MEAVIKLHQAVSGQSYLFRMPQVSTQSLCTPSISKLHGAHIRTPCLEQALSTAEAERADLALRHKHMLADEREAAAALAAHERKCADARQAKAAEELAHANADAARLHAELEEQSKEQERAAAQIRREREAEASTHDLPWVSWITSCGCCSAGCFHM